MEVLKNKGQNIISKATEWNLRRGIMMYEDSMKLRIFVHHYTTSSNKQKKMKNATSSTLDLRL